VIQTEPRSVDVLVCIGTYDRPADLARLLNALAPIQAIAPEAQFDVMVVDNHRSQSGRAVVAESALRCRYIAAQPANISVMRNAALDAASGCAAFLAFLDDDEVPDAEWLNEMLRVQRDTTADVVIGPVRPATDGPLPTWMRHRPFDRMEYADLSDPMAVNTGNSLLRCAFFTDAGLRFREDFGHSGGEDTYFFSEARKAGARVRYAAQSITWETVPADRLSLRFHVRRQVGIGVVGARVARGSDGMSRVRVLVRAARLLARGLKGVPAGLRGSEGSLSDRLAPALGWAALSWGWVRGALGLDVVRYGGS
jgi:succinoglycan biosynthesis protein ExoM